MEELEKSKEFTLVANEIKEIWSNILKISQESINLNDDFFFIGVILYQFSKFH